MENTKHRATIVIPTYDRSEKLVNLLNALECQTIRDFNTIVVDDGSTDNTQSELENNSFSLKSLTVLHQENSGHAVARNLGVDKASSDLIIFFDSDVRPFSDCVERHIMHHSSYRNSILTGRAVMDSTRFQTSDFCQYRYYLESEIWSFPSKTGIAKVTSENYFFSTQNLSLSKRLFIELGAFDETLKDSVDFDLCVRALIKSIPIYYDHGTAVWHDDQGDLQTYVNRQYEYRKARKHLAEKKPYYKNIIPDQFYEGKKDVIRDVFQRFFVFNQIWKKITSHRLYRIILPRSIRFRLYGYLIHCSSFYKV